MSHLFQLSRISSLERVQPSVRNVSVQLNARGELVLRASVSPALAGGSKYAVDWLRVTLE